MPKATKGKGRDVVYKTVKSLVHADGGDRVPLKAEWAKKTLGWEEVEGNDDHLFTYSPPEGNESSKTKIRCTNNVINRPLDMRNVLTLKQEILRGRWRLNCEPIILGKTALVLNGQHQLIALVLSTLEYLHNPEAYPHWNTEPHIAKVVSTGADESDAVVNTMDTCKPRSLADVIYRCPYFALAPPAQRKAASNVTQHAIRLLWERTGENLDGYSTYRSHSEYVDFLDRHLKILDCVNHIMLENGQAKKLSNYLSPGYCAGLMYLFAAAKTKTSDYLDQDKLLESNINWELWSKAEDFFVELANASIKPLINTLASYVEEQCADRNARQALLINAWNLYAVGKSITTKAIMLEYAQDDEGFSYLVDSPRVGGIDIGSLKELDEDELEKLTTHTVTVQEQEARTDEIRAEKRRNGNGKDKSPKSEKKTEGKRNKYKILVGKPRWIKPADGSEIYRCRVMDVFGETAKVKVLQGFQGAGNLHEVPIKSLLLEQPT